ncbi:MAG: L,D-transpeptidase family protein [Litorimonas sp.]
MKRALVLISMAFLWACQPSAQTPPMESHLSSELFIRIIKTTEAKDKGVLQMWKRGADDWFHLDRSFDICTWSGALGPKLREGDGQSPEGFYFIKPSSLNPNSSYHLSFNLGFPNAYDRSHDRTGSFLMVHGDCVSIGCYAMTDEGIEEIYADVEAAFAGGQNFIRVHVFPFEMTSENLESHAGNPNHLFWTNLKTGWDWFERENRPPNVTVVNNTYAFEASDG